MVTLRKGEPLYDAVFAGVTLLPFEAKGPTYQQITNAFTDPSVKDLLTKPERLNANQSHDIRSGMQTIVNALAVSTQDATPNFPSALLPAMRSILTSEDIGLSLKDSSVIDGVFSVASNAAKGNAVGTAGAVLAVGMTAVGIAVPVVGLIGAAIVGLATGIYSIFNAKSAAKVKSEQEYRALLYRSFPPLQMADSSTDGALVDAVLLPTVQGRDWTSIYRPRFVDDEWVGSEREGGFAFAPGKPGPNPEDFGATDAFTPSGGLGVIPGTTQVTAVVQVGLVVDPAADGGNAWESFLKGGRDPRGIDLNGVKGYTRVHDTGMYYPATGRLAGAVWSMALADGSPFKYRIDAKKLHEDWKRWAESGLRYIREVCYPWWPSVSDGNGHIAVHKLTNFEGFFGTAIFNSVGAWAGVVDKAKSTSNKLVYKTLEKPKGKTGPELVSILNAYGMVNSPVSSTYSGGFLPILDPASWPDQCMGTIYDRATNIKATLDNLRERQRYDLRNTLVCASVSVNDAAFVGDSKMMDLLLSLRAKLLTSTDRFYVDLDDVTDDEPGIKNGGKNEGSWRKQLMASGVTNDPKKLKGPLRLAPNSDKPPDAPPVHGGPANPWDPGRGFAPPSGGSGGGGGGLAVGIAGLTGAALITAFMLRNRKRRGFSAGRQR